MLGSFMVRTKSSTRLAEDLWCREHLVSSVSNHNTNKLRPELDSTSAMRGRAAFSMLQWYIGSRVRMTFE